MNRIVHDLKTGETTSIPYTAEELAEHQAKIAAYVPEVKPLCARDVIDKLTPEEALKLVDLLVLREVITPEKATLIKERKL